MYLIRTHDSSNEQRFYCVECEARQKRSVSRSRAGLALEADSQTVVLAVLLLSRLAHVEQLWLSAQARDKIFRNSRRLYPLYAAKASPARACAIMLSNCGLNAITIRSICDQIRLSRPRRAFSSPDPPVNMNFLKARAPDFANTFDGKRLSWPTPQKSKTRQNARSSSARRAKKPPPRPSAPPRAAHLRKK